MLAFVCQPLYYSLKMHHNDLTPIRSTACQPWGTKQSNTRHIHKQNNAEFPAALFLQRVYHCNKTKHAKLHPLDNQRLVINVVRLPPQRIPLKIPSLGIPSLGLRVPRWTLCRVSYTLSWSGEPHDMRGLDPRSEVGNIPCNSMQGKFDRHKIQIFQSTLNLTGWFRNDYFRVNI
jgi:hypothetical protein